MRPQAAIAATAAARVVAKPEIFMGTSREDADQST
jgi:hypothetical protein